MGHPLLVLLYSGYGVISLTVGCQPLFPFVSFLARALTFWSHGLYAMRLDNGYDMDWATGYDLLYGRPSAV